MPVAVALLTMLMSPAMWVEDYPKTKPELTNYEATSTYEDVITFIAALQRGGSPFRLMWTGKSFEGRAMPLVLVSYPPVADANEAKRTGKPIVYVQGNIHAGEVEGKEAAQVLLRRCAEEISLIKAGKRPKGAIVDKLILLVNPIYNSDGNEKWGPVARNRPEQIGPREVGVRANGQGFDLNRDCIKAESPEMQGALRFIYNAWDPDVIMDLHTTDGTRHGYDITYSPAMNPNTDPAVLKFSRDEMLPTIRKRFRDQFEQEIFDYGDAITRGGQTVFSTFASEGRYVTNYSGLRNRICVLSEAATYIPFKDRIVATERLVNEVLGYVASRSKDVVDITRRADEKVVAWGSKPASAPQLGVRFDFDSRGIEEVILEKPQKERAKGRPVDLERRKMPVVDRFKVTKWSSFPAAYLIPAEEAGVIGLLRSHGVVVERTLADWSGAAQVFTVAQFTQDATAFQGHKLIKLDGSFGNQEKLAPKGWYVVRTAQKLGVLAFSLLEPENTDGAAAWGFVKAPLASGSAYPILKVMQPMAIPSEVIG